MTMLGQNRLFSDPTLADLSTPGGIFGTGQMGGGDYAVPQQQAPFVWGAGGVKLTPDQLAARQQQATDRSKSDYSPVANVWAGLGRVADNALGAWQQKGLDKEYAAQSSVADGLIQGLTSADPAIQQQSVAAALTSGSPIAQKLALQVDERLHPKAQQPNEFQQYLMASGVQPGTPEWQKQNGLRAQASYDPIVNVTLPTGVFAGPRSMLPSSGGGSANTKTLPDGSTAYLVNGEWYDNPEGK